MKNIAFDLDFHPSNQLVAAGLITGNLYVYRYAEDSEPQRVLKVRAHSESCRAVRFINEGRVILTGSQIVLFLQLILKQDLQLLVLKILMRKL